MMLYTASRYVIGHHAPHKAGQFPCYCGYRYITDLILPEDQPVITPPEAFVRLIRIRDDLWSIP